MSKKKSSKNKTLCSAEQAINTVKWDKHSLWTKLVNKTGLTPWKTPHVTVLGNNKK